MSILSTGSGKRVPQNAPTTAYTPDWYSPAQPCPSCASWDRSELVSLHLHLSVQSFTAKRHQISQENLPAAAG